MREAVSGLRIIEMLAVLRDPASYPKQAALLIAAIVVTLIIVILVVGIAMVGAEVARGRPGPAPARRPTRVRRDLWVVLGGWVAAVGVVLVAGGVVLTDTATCVRCHRDRFEASAEHSQAHSQIACASCHAEPGIGGRTALGVQTLADVVAQTSGRDLGTAERRPRSSSCLRCHVGIGNALVRRIVRVSHAEFVDDPAYRCTDCHASVGHGPRGEPDDRPRMTLCLRCHDGTGASADCSVCHPGGITDVRGVSAYDYPIVQLPPVTTCEGCHSMERCDACHGLRMPHPADWAEVGRHGRAGAFTRREKCKKCHERADCQSACHPVGAFPGDGHVAEWDTLHGADASPEALARCRQCHSAAGFSCRSCHD